MMIFISTGGFKGQTPEDTARKLLNHGIHQIELSSGRFSPETFSSLNTLKKQAVFQVHNYFPPPEKPFILNLASLEETISERSRLHCQKAIDWAVSLGKPVYSVHAGFLMNPSVSELGAPIQKKKLFDRSRATERFLDNVHRVAEYAETKGVRLLIENNVLSEKNMNTFAENPFLMATPEECAGMMKQLPSSVGMLLDVAHAKVSCRSLGRLDAADFFHKCGGWIRAYHLSDNDGSEDSNHPVTKDSWFWSYLNRDVDACTLEVYHLSPEDLKNQVKLTEECLRESFMS